MDGRLQKVWPARIRGSKAVQERDARRSQAASPLELLGAADVPCGVHRPLELSEEGQHDAPG
jgi:hypothetical protein